MRKLILFGLIGLFLGGCVHTRISPNKILSLSNKKLFWHIRNRTNVLTGGCFYTKNTMCRLYEEAVCRDLLTQEEVELIKNRQIKIGSSEKLLRLSWGLPEDINSSTGSWGVHKQYVYGEFPHALYVYVENGKVTSWQD